MAASPFVSPADAARALLMLEFPKLTRRSGQFCGGLMFDDEPLSDKQTRWLSDLLRKHGLPLWRRRARAMTADTSAAAWASIADAAPRLRAIVYKALHTSPGGLTVDETCALAGYPRYSLQPRFTELLHAGSIIDTGRRRLNVSGAKARVWAIADRGEVAQ